MAARVPVKSILRKQPKAKSEPSEADAKAEKDRRNLDIALQHAHLIQHQKDIQAKILSAIEILLDFPSATKSTSEDAIKYPILVQPFQPSDLDALVEERRVASKCGYVLCSNVPRVISMGESAMWKLGKSGGDYCSNVCMRKSFYVKTQLSEVPAWERDPSYQVKVVLHEDDRPQTATPQKQTLGRQHVLPADAQELAAERGETSTSFRPKQVMADRIVEKREVSYKPLSSVEAAAVSHTAIEGYEPKGIAKGPSGAQNDDDNDDDDDDDDNDDDQLTEELFGDIDERGVGAQWQRPDGTIGSIWNGKEDFDSDR